MVEKSDQLLNEFSRLFRRQPISTWGLQIGDGWLDLVRQLCVDIEAAASKAGLDRESEDWPVALQIKEKFGLLRFYFVAPDSIHEEIRALVDAAQAASASICEGCGAPGVLRHDGWIHVGCDDCESRT